MKVKVYQVSFASFRRCSAHFGFEDDDNELFFLKVE